MDHKHSIEVSVLGQRLALKVDDVEHLERVVQFLNQRIDDTSRMTQVPAAKRAVLAAMNIADEYLRNTDEHQVFRQEVAARSRSILAELDD